MKYWLPLLNYIYAFISAGVFLWMLTSYITCFRWVWVSFLLGQSSLLCCSPPFPFFKYYVFKHSSWLMLFRHLNLPWIWAKTWMVVRTRTLNMPCMIIYSVRGIAAPVSLPQLLECIVPNLVEPVVVKETTQCAGHQMGWQLMRSLR